VTVHVERIEERIDEFSGRLGRHVEHDQRSLEHAVEHLVDELLPPKSVLWHRWSPILNQGELGSCTGNALTGLLACEPFCASAAAAAPYTEQFAVSLYSHATEIDGIPGQYPPEDTGSSGLAVCKVAKRMGLIGSYNHALSVNGLLHALQIQPVIVGVPWFEGFDQPDSTGLVHATGQIRGGHEFVIRGYEHDDDSEDDSYLFADNSWGDGWGVRGHFRFTVSTWRTLMSHQADVTIPKQ
jgi:hypothetical protein